MRFIRSRFGIVLWCAIALIILAVPLWRLRAVREWNFDSVRDALLVDSVSSSAVRAPLVVGALSAPDPTPIPLPYGFVGGDKVAAMKRFSNEPIAQLMRLDALPVNFEVHNLYNGLYQNYPDAKNLAQAKKRLQKVQPSIWKTTDAYFDQYRTLERQFPDSDLVRARHLSDVTLMTYVSDLATDKLRIPAGSLFLKFDSPASNRALEEAIRVAREGARLRPDNAFFPWMEAIFQFALERPDGALLALEAAGRCATFDDYTFRNLDERTLLLRQLRATGWEDDLTEWMNTLFPHFALMRGVARAASWQMHLARKRKDESSVFRWASATARAAYPVARSQRNSVICVLVGQAICNIAWKAAVEDEPEAPSRLAPGTPPLPPPTTQDYESTQKTNVELFAKAAHANGDDALAQQTLAVAASFDGRTLSQYSESDSSGQFSQFLWLSGFYWVGAQLMRIALGGALLWFVCWLFTRRATTIAATRAKMLLPSMFCMGITTAVLVGAFWVSPKITDLIFGSINPNESEPFSIDAILRDRWPLILGLFWGILVVGGAIMSTRREQKKSGESLLQPWIDIFLWALLVDCLAPVFYFYPNYKPADYANNGLIYSAMLILGAFFVAATFISVRRSGEGTKRVLTICLVGIFWTGVALPALASLVFSDALDPLFWFGVAPLVVGALLSSLLLIIRGWNGITFKDFTFHLAARTRIASGVLALLCAVAYFGITLWTIPVEAKTRSMMRRQLQIGEVAWLREQIAAGK